MWFLRNWHDSPSILKKGNQKTKVNIWPPAHTCLFFVLITSSLLHATWQILSRALCHQCGPTPSPTPPFPSFHPSFNAWAAFSTTVKVEFRWFFFEHAVFNNLHTFAAIYSISFFAWRSFTLCSEPQPFHTVNSICNAISHFTTPLIYHNRHPDHQI